MGGLRQLHLFRKRVDVGFKKLKKLIFLFSKKSRLRVYGSEKVCKSIRFFRKRRTGSGEVLGG